MEIIHFTGQHCQYRDYPYCGQHGRNIKCSVILENVSCLRCLELLCLRTRKAYDKLKIDKKGQ